MDILEAIKSRKSIRAFKPGSVPMKILIDLLEVATRAPSSVNIQPWEFFIVEGEPLNELQTACVEQYRQGIEPHPEIYFGKIRKLPKLEGVYRDRQVGLAKQIYEIMGINKKDKKGAQEWTERMYRFYDAPAIIIIVVDRILQESWPIFDTGLVTQNIAIAAQAYGLGTCIMRAIVDYPEQVTKILKIPKSKRLIVGIAIGYPDRNHPIARLKTNRESIDKIITGVKS
jgi:nitroreductase